MNTSLESLQFDYALGFKINEETAVSQKLDVTLKTSKNTGKIKWEGLLGEDVYSTKDANIITGICLFDCRWKVEFLNERFPSKNGATKVIALESTRKQALDLMEKKRQIKCFYLPKTLGEYHIKYFDWLREKVSQLAPKHVYIQNPIDEYHIYINQIENSCRKSLPDMHTQLDVFSTLVMNEFEKIMSESKIDYTFIRPMKDNGVTDPVESYLWPYQNLPSMMGEDETFIGIEDLNEVKLILSSVVKKGILAVFDLPDPYMNSTITEENSIIMKID